MSNTYKVFYSKCGYPLTAVKSSEAEAKAFAEKMRKVGYDAEVWCYNANGAKFVK